MRVSYFKLALAATTFLAFAIASCGGDRSVPAEPTWFEDVEPILRGNCLHCHGSEAEKITGIRFDVYDTADPSYAGLDVAAFQVIGARTEAENMSFSARLSHPEAPGAMPPLPAPRLSQRDVDVIVLWETNPIRGTRTGNHVPTATLIASSSHDDKIDVSVLVADGDRDQVLGQLTYGMAVLPLPRTGAHHLTFDAAGAQDLSATLSDGQDAVTVPLGTVSP